MYNKLRCQRNIAIRRPIDKYNQPGFPAPTFNFGSILTPWVATNNYGHSRDTHLNGWNLA